MSNEELKYMAIVKHQCVEDVDNMIETYLHHIICSLNVNGILLFVYMNCCNWMTIMTL